MSSCSLLTIFLLALFGLATHGMPTIGITGSKFFTSEGKQFYIKGVAYQLIEDDPLVDTAQCQRDAVLMQKLGANSIRVYHINATANHSGCMNAFAQVGIYLWVDLDSFKTYIELDTKPAWTQDKSNSFRAVMDNFQQYDNTAGFFVGNEVLNNLSDSGSAPYLLSAKRDLQAYAKQKGYRPIPIGYSATDTDALPMLQDYLTCRPNGDERLDFYALNSYRWCGDSTFEQSGYNTLLNSTADTPVPIFFSEDGCNIPPPRTFADQTAVFGQMANVWSGAIIYEWIQETNAYGLITYGPQQDSSVNEGSSVVQGFTRTGTPTAIAPDFSNLQGQWATLNPTGVDFSAYAATVKITTPACPASTAGANAWSVDPSAALPTMGLAGSSGMTPELSVPIPCASITAEPSSSLSTLASGVSGTENRADSSTFLSRGTPNLPPTGANASASGNGSTSRPSHAAGNPTAQLPFDLKSTAAPKAMLAIVFVFLGATIFL